jgi:hypothetical protein
MASIPVLTHATERDIDLLIVEELDCSPLFVSWIIRTIEAQIDRTLRYSLSDVIHSDQRTLHRRQIDICLTLTSEGVLPIKIFIENKLDATDQPNQAEFYHAEARRLIGESLVETAVPVLLCPDEYAIQNSAFAAKFPARISYEDIVDFLRKRA